MTNASGAMCWPITCKVPNGSLTRAMVVCDQGPSPRNDPLIELRRLPPTLLAAGCQASKPSRAHVTSKPVDGAAIRRRLRRGCHAARSIVQYIRPSGPGAEAVPMLVNAGLRMFARCGGLFNQALTASSVVRCPRATFSPHVCQPNPADCIRWPGVDPFAPLCVIVCRAAWSAE